MIIRFEVQRLADEYPLNVLCWTSNGLSFPLWTFAEPFRRWHVQFHSVEWNLFHMIEYERVFEMKMYLHATTLAILRNHVIIVMPFSTRFTTFALTQIQFDIRCTKLYTDTRTITCELCGFISTNAVNLAFSNRRSGKFQIIWRKHLKLGKLRTEFGV